MKIELITAESERTRHLRLGRLIRFPQLTMPLVAALTPAGVQIHHTDEIVQEVDFRRPADLVGITATTCASTHAYELADEFRARGVKVVIGGPHATLMPEEAKTHADAVVIGEAELTWPELVEDYRQERLKSFYSSACAPSLKGLPQARRDLITGRYYGRGLLIATRSCPHKCGYCVLPHYYHHEYRCRPAGEVIAEIAAIKEKAIIFWDDNIVGDFAYAKKLFRAMIPLKRWWTSQATFSITEDDELIDLAAQSGCQALFIGLESISTKSLMETGKGFNKPSKYIEGIKKLHAAGIAVQAGIVFGFDNDDLSVFERTVEFLDKAGVDVASVGSFTPFPGTPVFKKLHGEGRILTTDWTKYNARTHVVFRPEQMTPDQLQNGVEWVTKAFYAMNSISKRLLRSRCGLWWNIPRNLGYKIAFSKYRKKPYLPGDMRVGQESQEAGASSRR